MGVAGRVEETRVRGTEGTRLIAGRAAAVASGKTAEWTQAAVHAVERANELERPDGVVDSRVGLGFRSRLANENRVCLRPVAAGEQRLPAGVDEVAVDDSGGL